MTTGRACRLIVEPTPLPGAWNMAVDEVLLISALERGVTTLRIYEWSEATVSLGYFQSADDDSIAEPLRGLPAVRRLSGGGALLHHHEWTYSLAVPADHPLAQAPTTLYDQVHAATISALAEVGVEATTFEAAADSRSRQAAESAVEPFLCFARRDPRDLVCQGHKILGSAQRRRRQAVLQHGGLLLQASPHLPELSGLLDVTDRSVDLGALRSGWHRRILRALGQVAETGELEPAELELARELVRSKYEGLVWSRGVPVSDHP